MSAPALRTRPSALPPTPVDLPEPTSAPSWRRRLLPVLQRHRRLLIGTAVLAAIYAGLGSTLPLVQQIVLDDAIITGDRPLLPWLGLLVGIGLTIGALSMVWRYRSGKAALAIQHDIRNDIYDTLQRLDFSGHSQLQSGQLVSRASTDLRWVQMLIGFIAEVAATSVGIAVSLVVMFRLSPLLAVVVMIIIVTVFAITHRMRSRCTPPAGTPSRRRPS